MACPVTGYSTAAGSHVWNGRGVHVEGAHTEVSGPLASSCYRPAELFRFDLTTIFLV